MKKEEPSCAACQSSRIVYDSPIDEEDDLYICGIDYHYECKLTNETVGRNHFCDKFELPF